MKNLMKRILVMRCKKIVATDCTDERRFYFLRLANNEPGLNSYSTDERIDYFFFLPKRKK